MIPFLVSEPLSETVGLTTGGAIGIGCSIFILALLLITIVSVALYMLILRGSRQRAMQRKSRTCLLLPLLCEANSFSYNTAQSGDDSMEFPRRDLEFQQLGS